ncbi:TPA: DUF1472 domain-containing protein [Enterobacter hormaechei subsp. steigerwaltii]|nr:DUF1472 domain-containing protein [Enterobacter hormaechei subsp. steigerwaltii]
MPFSHPFAHVVEHSAHNAFALRLPFTPLSPPLFARLRFAHGTTPCRICVNRVGGENPPGEEHETRNDSPGTERTLVPLSR